MKVHVLTRLISSTLRTHSHSSGLRSSPGSGRSERRKLLPRPVRQSRFRAREAALRLGVPPLNLRLKLHGSGKEVPQLDPVFPSTIAERNGAQVQQLF